MKKKIEYLSKDEYINHVNELEDDGHWTENTITNRWDYFYRTVEIVKSTKVNDPAKVLEMGTMGISCVKESDTIDYLERWDFDGKNPTHIHDARKFPWPIKDKAYDVFIALRVYQHLVPFQKEAILEAFRIAKKVILVIPEHYNNSVLPESKGINYKDTLAVLNEVHPNVYLPTSFGNLYYWDTENPSHFNLESVMNNINLFEIKKENNISSVSNNNKINTILKKLFKS